MRVSEYKHGVVTVRVVDGAHTPARILLAQTLAKGTFDRMWRMVQLANHIYVYLVEVKEWATFVDHPSQREVSEVLVNISTADIGVDTWEPTLLKVDTYRTH